MDRVYSEDVGTVTVDRGYNEGIGTVTVDKGYSALLTVKHNGRMSTTSGCQADLSEDSWKNNKVPNMGKLLGNVRIIITVRF